VSQAREGDDSAFEEIVRRHSARVFHVISRFFRSRSQVEDMAQEVFLKAYTELSSYEGRGSFEGWLSRIATNTCLNELRSRKRHPESLVSDLTEDENSWLENLPAAVSVESPERNVIIADLTEKVLSKLSPDDRVVLTLMDGEDLSVKEVAELTGWSQANIKVKAFRARRRMRKLLEDLLGKGKSDKLSLKKGATDR
jgi:RNA polymerase sigma-70 factor (ECF subfamily)